MDLGLRNGLLAHEGVNNGLCVQKMGKIGADGIVAELKARGSSSGKVRMLTHCNTGSLATAAYGTALGVVRSLHESGQLAHAYCTETRPYNQGMASPALRVLSCPSSRVH